MPRRKKGEPHVLPPEPDNQVHVPRIMSPDAAIFPPKLRFALQCYLDTSPRNAERACLRAQMNLEEFKKHLHSPGVRAWLAEQEALIDEKACELRAKARILTEDCLDAATVDLLESKDTPAAVKATVVATGYKRFGMLKEKVEATGAGGAPLAFSLVRIHGRKDTDADAGS